MKSLHTSSTASSGLRNASLFSAFALVLAFAFGVSTTTYSFDTASQQLLPDDDGGALLADLPDLHDPFIIAHIALSPRAVWQPVHRCCVSIPSIALPKAYAFSARAPPLLTV